MLLSWVGLSTICIATANAHGGVWNYVIHNETYNGYQWWDRDSNATRPRGVCQYGTPPANQSTIQRKWPCVNPISDLASPYFACNLDGSANSGLHAKVRAGSTVDAHYDAEQDIGEVDINGDRIVVYSGWPHEWGPIIAYMAACNGPCNEVNVTDGARRWFKIYEGGLINGTASTGYWKMKDLYNLQPFTVTIPKMLKPGNYLIRHEIIAIHFASPMYYMECAQLQVMGHGGATPEDEYLVSFPGAYSPNDPALLNYKIWTSNASDTTYPIPGPKVWTG